MKGQLPGIAGGSAEAFAGARVPEAPCCRGEHVGRPGTGALLKLPAKLLVALYRRMPSESPALPWGNGIAPKPAVNLLETLNGSGRVATFDIAGLAEDRSLGIPLPLAGAARRSCADALAGPGRFEGARLSRRVAEGGA